VKEEYVLHDIVNIIIENARYYVIEMNMEINRAKISLKANIPT